MKKGKEKPSSSTSTAIIESKSSDDAPLTKSTVATAKHNAVSDSNNSSANANTVKKACDSSQNHCEVYMEAKLYTSFARASEYSQHTSSTHVCFFKVYIPEGVRRRL
ncbi:hypothetical protein RMATCC62417_15805 [Rhizopus microsporus]|nr:hypothetical protein RMATCC62417_15805 [Rhizopus microsporus]